VGKRFPLERKRQRGVLSLKRRYFAAIGLFSVKTIADRYRHVDHHNKDWSRAFIILSKSMTLNDFKPSQKGGGLVNFL